MLHLFIAPIIAVLDHSIKKSREENDTAYEYLDGKIRIITYHNRGAFLGRGSKNPFLVTVLSVALTLVMGLVFVLTFTMTGLKTLKFGLGLLLGGAFSNTYDRIKKGYVTDYLIFSKAPGFIKNIVFNISDFAIITGALISALS